MQTPRGLHGVIVHTLGSRIAARTYTAGEALKSDALLREFDASRPTMREALRVLESKGMLRIRQSLGTRVQPSDEWNLLDTEVVGWLLRTKHHQRQLRELYEMRLAIEPTAARLAARRQDPEAVSSLRSAWSAMESAVNAQDLHEFTDADVAFHASLLAGSGNQMFDQLTELVAAALEAREETLSRHHVDLSAEALAEHRAVLQAIVDGDEELAEQTMRHMLRELLDADQAAGGAGL